MDSLFQYSSKYDEYFYSYCHEFFGNNFDFRWFKAQAIAESVLAENAISPVGAIGVMQIMPDTFQWLQSMVDVYDIKDPKDNIKVGIFYNKRLYDEWSSPRPFEHRMAFTFASYNAGLGNILKAQKACQHNGVEPNCNLWTSVEKFGGVVPSWKHTETIEYIDRIFNKILRIPLL